MPADPLKKENAMLRARVGRLSTALSFYADAKNYGRQERGWSFNGVDEYWDDTLYDSEVQSDEGYVARKALTVDKPVVMDGE